MFERFNDYIRQDDLHVDYPDTTDTIFTDSGIESDNYPLNVEDPEEYRTSLAIIRKYLLNWMVQDQVMTTSVNQPVESCLSYSIKDIDLKFLPYPTYATKLEEILQDTEINHSGSRLMDTFNRIYLEIAPQHIRVLQGRFIYGMLYGLSATVNGMTLPSKEMWLDYMAAHPWIPFLAIIQDIYENERIYGEVMKHVQQAKAPATVANNVQSFVQRPGNPLPPNTRVVGQPRTPQASS